MIEKKTPKLSDSSEPDSADEAVPASEGGPAGIPPQPSDAEDSILHGLHPGAPDEDDDAEMDEYDVDPAEEARKRKQRGNLVFYGGIAIVEVVVGVFAFPHFKKQFQTAPVQQQHIANVPFPEAATKPHFTLNKDEDKPKGPAGGMPGNQAELPSMPTTPPQQAVAPPDMLPLQPTTVAPHVDTAAAEIGALNKPSTPPVEATPPPSPATAVAPPPMDETPATAVAPPVLPGVAVNSAPPAPIAPAIAPTPATLPPPAVAAMGAPTATLGAPMTDDAKTRLADLSSKVSALQTSVSALTANKDATEARLQQIQASLDKLQQQIADISRINNGSAAPAVPRPRAEHAAPQPAAQPAVKWELRSATPDMALLAHPGDQSLQRVAVGDMVSGLGRIISIREHDGSWVVRGTKGSVTQ